MPEPSPAPTDDHPNLTEEWVTLQEAAVLLNVTEKTIYSRIKAGTLQSKKEGGRTLALLPPGVHKPQTTEILPAPVVPLEAVKELFHDALSQIAEGQRRALSDRHEDLDGKLGETQACMGNLRSSLSELSETLQTAEAERRREREADHAALLALHATLETVREELREARQTRQRSEPRRGVPWWWRFGKR